MSPLGDLKSVARFRTELDGAERARIYRESALRFRNRRERPADRALLAQIQFDRRRKAQLAVIVDALETGASDEAILDALHAAPTMPWRLAA